MQTKNAPRLRAAHGWLLGVFLALLLLQPVVWLIVPRPAAAEPTPDASSGVLNAQRHPVSPPHVQAEPFVRPDLARRLERLRPTILAAAHRHNHPELSGMSDTEFATVIALVIYNENFGWVEDDVAPLRVFTPLYQDLQRQANERLPGSNFSVWPTNLRPSVALEILEQELPLTGARVITVPVTVEGSTISPDAYTSREALFAALTAEISRDDLAVAYLAANLERGLYRAALEGVPVSWRTLAAWHNQGIVVPQLIRENPTARDYVRRAAAYLPLARALVTDTEDTTVSARGRMRSTAQ